MNALTQLCAKISQAGYSDNPRIDSHLHNDSVLNLGKFLLNHPPRETPLNLRWEQSDGQDVAIGFGGGIDSYCAFLQACRTYKRVFLVFIDYGQSSVLPEAEVFDAVGRAVQFASGVFPHGCTGQAFWEDLQKVARFNNPAIWFKRDTIPLVPVANIDRKYDLGWKDYIIPARNLVLAAACAEVSSNVWIIANKRKDETVGTPDKTTKFYRQASAAFSEHYGRDVTVSSPFLDRTKLEVVKETLAWTNNVKALKSTFSCYTPYNVWQPCGVCYACYKRFKLFQALNEEFDFHTHPQSGPHFHEYEEAERKKRG